MLTRAGFIKVAFAGLAGLAAGCRRQPAFPLGDYKSLDDVRAAVREGRLAWVGRSVGKSLRSPASAEHDARRIWEWVIQQQLHRKHNA